MAIKAGNQFENPKIEVVFHHHIVNHTQTFHGCMAPLLLRAAWHCANMPVDNPLDSLYIASHAVTLSPVWYLNWSLRTVEST